MTKRIRTAFFGALALTAFGLAEGAAQSDEDPCADPITQSDMNACASTQARAAEIKMLQVARRVAAALQSYDQSAREMGGEDSHEREAFEEAQSQWAEAVRLDCRVEGVLARGGSMEPLLISQCLLRRFERREADLLDLLKQL